MKTKNCAYCGAEFEPVRDENCCDTFCAESWVDYCRRKDYEKSPDDNWMRDFLSWETQTFYDEYV
jgi:predicted amidophosphoribosyltransferase